jgi:hypothetical protein
MDGLLNGIAKRNNSRYYGDSSDDPLAGLWKSEYTPAEVSEYKNFVGTYGGFERLPSSLQAQIWDSSTEEEQALAKFAAARKAEDNPGIGGAISSLFTGGLSDVVQGNAPGSGLGNLSPIMSFMNPGLVSGYGVIDNLKEGNWAKALNYAIDPITEPGIDYLATASGKQLEKLVPGVTQYGPTLGALIGTAIAPGYGTLAGFELGNKIKGGSALDGVLGGAAIGATYGLSSLLSPYLSGVLGDKAGAVAGKAIGNIGGKAVNIGGKLLSNYLNPKNVGTTVSPLLMQLLAQDSTLQSGQTPDLSSIQNAIANTPYASGGLLGETSAPMLQQQSQQALNPINWASEVEKLRMPLMIKKKEEDEEGYMNYRFKPKDYLVDYLGG